MVMNAFSLRMSKTLQVRFSLSVIRNKKKVGLFKYLILKNLILATSNLNGEQDMLADIVKTMKLLK